MRTSQNRQRSLLRARFAAVVAVLGLVLAATAGAADLQLDFVNLPNVSVVDSYFTVNLDFATPQLFVIQDLWLEIRVRPLGGVQAILELRQPVMAVPRALTANNAVTGVTAGSGLSGGGGPGAVTVFLDPAVTQVNADLETLVSSQAAVITALETQVHFSHAETIPPRCSRPQESLWLPAAPPPTAREIRAPRPSTAFSIRTSTRSRGSGRRSTSGGAVSGGASSTSRCCAS